MRRMWLGLEIVVAGLSQLQKERLDVQGINLLLKNY